MAYCRWSSDNWKSDVYVYEGANWVVHVAGSRRLGLDTLPPDPISVLCSNDNSAWLDAYNKHRAMLQALPFEEIKLPHAGTSMEFAEPGRCARFLRELRDLGYHIPNGVIETLIEEQTEIDNGETKGLSTE